jgi:SPP1 gp7 family putative phage head morphogenesis protein
MEGHAIAGSNPRTVAARLRKLFDDANADWERLARSEIAMAGEKAKKEEWKAEEVEELEFVPNPDACPICLALAGTYPIDDCPVPVEDTHPNCRCATMPSDV